MGNNCCAEDQIDLRKIPEPGLLENHSIKILNSKFSDMEAIRTQSDHGPSKTRAQLLERIP